MYWWVCKLLAVFAYLLCVNIDIWYLHWPIYSPSMCRGPARVVSIQARPTSVPSFSVSSNLAVSVACHSSRMSKLWEITSYSKDIKDIQISRPFQNEYRKLMEDFHATSFKFSQTWTLLRKTLETTRSRKKKYWWKQESSRISIPFQKIPSASKAPASSCLL